MNISKSIKPASALILGVVAIFATTPKKKTVDFCVKFSANCLTGTFTANTSCFTIIATNHHKVQLITSTGTILGTLITCVTGRTVYHL